jgi:hypothetical protein
MRDAGACIGLEISKAEAVSAYRILVNRPYLDDAGEASLLKKLEDALYGLLSLEEMEELKSGGAHGGA